MDEGTYEGTAYVHPIERSGMYVRAENRDVVGSYFVCFAKSLESGEK